MNVAISMVASKTQVVNDIDFTEPPLAVHAEYSSDTQPPDRLRRGVGHLLSFRGYQGRQLGAAQRVLQGLGRRPATEAVSLVTSLEVVVRQEPIQVTLNLGRLEIPGRPARHPEALVEQRAVHALDEAVGAG